MSNGIHRRCFWKVDPQGEDGFHEDEAEVNNQDQNRNQIMTPTRMLERQLERLFYDEIPERTIIEISDLDVMDMSQRACNLVIIFTAAIGCLMHYRVKHTASEYQRFTSMNLFLAVDLFEKLLKVFERPDFVTRIEFGSKENESSLRKAITENSLALVRRIFELVHYDYPSSFTREYEYLYTVIDFIMHVKNVLEDIHEMSHVIALKHLEKTLRDTSTSSRHASLRELAEFSLTLFCKSKSTPGNKHYRLMREWTQ